MLQNDFSLSPVAGGRGGFLSSPGAVPSRDPIVPTVVVLAPSAGDVLTVGHPFIISWTSFDNVGVVSHNIELSLDGGASFPITIASNLPGTAQSFTWTPTAAQATDQARVRVAAFDAANNRSSNDSANFRIQSQNQASDTAPPSVTVIAPNGGEVLSAGQPVTIAWRSVDNVRVVSHDIELSLDGGVSFPFDIATRLPGSAQSFTWAPTAEQATPQARVRVAAIDAAGNRGRDDSDADFRIQATGAALSVSPTMQSITAGQSATFTISLNRMGISGAVNLAVSGLPDGVTAFFSPNPIVDNSSAMTVNTTTSATARSSTLTISGTVSGGAIAPTIVSLTVNPAQVSTVTLSASPSSQTVNAGQSLSYTIFINRQNFAGAVDLAVSGLPPGATAAFSSDPAFDNRSVLTISTSATTPGGSSILTVSGVAAGIEVAPISVSLTVNAENPSPIQLPDRAKAVRVAQLLPGQQDFVYLVRSGAVVAFNAGDRRPRTIVPANPNDPQDLTYLIDVTDFDGDGSPEIIGMHAGSSDPNDDTIPRTAPALYIYKSDGTLKLKYSFPLGTGVGPGGVKIYQSLATGQKRIVVAPDTNMTGYAQKNDNGFVYFVDPSGLVKQSEKIPVNARGPINNRLILTFPGVVVGDFDSSVKDRLEGKNRNRVVVIAKSRLLVFDEDGSKLYYKQFVDPKTDKFTDYGSSPDRPNPPLTCTSDPTRFLEWQGRRYGLYKLVDVDGDGKLELIVAADGNNISNCLAGAVYEAYKLPGFGDANARYDGYLGPLWRTYLQRSAVAYGVCEVPNLPLGYAIGVSANGIMDINNDGIPEIVVTEALPGGQPVVKIINGRTGAITDPGIPGVCLDVVNLSATLPFKDLIVYNPSTRKHTVWRINRPGTFALSPVPEELPLDGFTALVGRQYPADFLYAPDTGENRDHFSVLVTRSDANVTTFVGYTSAGSSEQQSKLSGPNPCEQSQQKPQPVLNVLCPTGLRSWSAAGSTVQRSLDLDMRPGRVTNILEANGKPTWFVEVEPACPQRSNQAITLVQQGPRLVPDGRPQPGAGVSLSAYPATQTSGQGQSASYTIAIQRTNFTGAVSLAVSGLPVGTTAVFSPNPTTGDSAVLTINTTANTAPGSSTLTISGTAPGVTIAPISVTLTVAASSPSITGFSPTSGQVNTLVTISGSNFTGVTAVRFNGVPATFTLNSSSSISAFVPVSATTGPIEVLTQAGNALSPTSFIVTAPKEKEKEGKENKDKEGKEGRKDVGDKDRLKDNKDRQDGKGFGFEASSFQAGGVVPPASARSANADAGHPGLAKDPLQHFIGRALRPTLDQGLFDATSNPSDGDPAASSHNRQALASQTEAAKGAE
jgi:hypothetical protein